MAGGPLALIEQEDRSTGVRVLRLNRPDRRNALSGELVEALLRAITQAEADPEVRVIVLHGSGGTFCAGGDLAGGLGGTGGLVAAHQQRGVFGEVLVRLMKSPLVSIAAIEGDALGGGLGLAVACDVGIAAPAARFGTPEIKLGLFPWIILAVLQRNVGRKALMELVLTGSRVDAPRALELGLITRVAESTDPLSEALSLAETLAARAPIALALGKQTFQAVADQPLDDAVRFLNTHLTLNLMTEDAMEGVAAFLQRREPSWKGR